MDNQTEIISSYKFMKNEESPQIRKKSGGE